MAAPTLNDVLAALEKLSAKIDAKADAAEMREGFARLEKTKAGAAEMREGFARLEKTKAGAAEMREGFARLEKKIDDLDRDIDGHMKVHREIEKDIEALKKRPVRTAASTRTSTT